MNTFKIDRRVAALAISHGQIGFLTIKVSARTDAHEITGLLEERNRHIKGIRELLGKFVGGFGLKSTFDFGDLRLANPEYVGQLLLR